ncbi:zinc finger protein 568-like [Harpegnathos saltator]|uniref:zinc finger protein 568-like n=1 Tax=Harpegnathos saltator TaxID=610380 RepID=UPI000DBEF0A6|nr:zinc finger protein 568-like [Harpegnathos saltator]
MNFSEVQMDDIITSSITSPQFLELPFRANSNVTTFAEHNSGGNMQSQEAQTSISAIADLKTESYPQHQQHLSYNMANTMSDYLHKWHTSTLPLITLQFVKQQVEQLKKEKVGEEKVEHVQNNILNIPSVPVFRSSQVQNSSNFTNTDPMLMSVNPFDLNVHLESEQENESNSQPVVKVEQQVQTDSPKIEKKPRFRAKIGEIKISVDSRGSTYYCCPECNIGYTDKADIDKHIQAHIQERKYECKECGALLKRKEHLDQHMRGHSDERPFKCKVCEKAFKRNEHLTRHFVIHSGDKNFLCTVCNKAFSRKDHLNKHTQTHSGMRKNKMKNNTFYIDQKDPFDKSTDVSTTVPRQEAKYVLKDSMPKESILSQIPESVLLQNIQNLARDPNLLHTLSSLKEQMMRESSVMQQDDINTDEILPDNVRYIMQS